MPNKKGENGGRNKLLHRFYEPLAVLCAIDFVQGEKVVRPGSENLPLHEMSLVELRRRFLDALCYICDFEKGGDTTTAMAIIPIPLTYNVTCNKAKASHVVNVKNFLKDVFKELASVYDLSSEDEVIIEKRLFGRCVFMSMPRLQTYQRSLFVWLNRCMEDPKGLEKDLVSLKQRLSNAGSCMKDFCLLCRDVLQSAALKTIKQQAKMSEQQGEQYHGFDKLYHHISRVAYHVRVVEVLMEAGRRLPALLETPEIYFIVPEISPTPLPHLRQQATLVDIAKRMQPAGASPAIHQRLEELDRVFNIKSRIKELYGKPNFKPIMHAEMVVLEYLQSQRDEIDLGPEDRYIGCSKPACFCCYLYIQHHPGLFVLPATHQKLYFNWMPPTNTCGVDDSTSEIANHEIIMMNSMIASVRRKLVEQITTRSGRRKQHFDSATADSFINFVGQERASSSRFDASTTPMGDNPTYQMAVGTLEGSATDSRSAVDGSTTSETEDIGLRRMTHQLQNVSLREEESDMEEGGVSLTAIFGQNC